MTLVNITVIVRRAYSWQDAKIGEIALSSADRERFTAKVGAADADDCWLWQASKLGHQYGQFCARKPSGKQAHLYAHRVAWTLSQGEIPDGLMVLHHCDVPLCVNPSHLFLGDQFTNMQDAAAKGRLSVPRKRRQKISDAECDGIIARVAAGERKTDVAREHGVSRSFVGLLVKGERRQFREGTAA